jgi:sugar phosphate isomerase/epimerase
MRLGGMLFRPETIAELDAIVPALDTYGLSAIVAPLALAEMSDDDARAFGQRARELDIVIAEAHYLVNLLVRDPQLRAERVLELRTLLRKADLMGCRGVIGFVGTIDPVDDIGKPHPYLFTDDCKREFREVVLSVLDGLELDACDYMVEGSPKSFFYRPEEIAEFMASISHPSFGFHLDQMNMVDQRSYFHTTELIDTTFDLLASYIRGVHLKDILWDWEFMFLKFDEVLIGDGVLDYATLLQHLSRLPPDMPALCEHLETEGEYAMNFARVHALAAAGDSPFVLCVPAESAAAPAGGASR